MVPSRVPSSFLMVASVDEAVVTVSVCSTSVLSSDSLQVTVEGEIDHLDVEEISVLVSEAEYGDQPLAPAAKYVVCVKLHRVLVDCGRFY